MKKLVVFCLSLFSLLLFSIQINGQGAGTNPELVMYRYNNFPVKPSPVLDKDLLGTLKWEGLTGIGADGIRSGASIQSYVTGPVSYGVLPANLVFRTGAFDQHNRMVVTADGLVGIGTMDPLYHLHVVGNTHTTGDFFGRIHMDNNPGDPGPDTYLQEAYFENKSGAQLSAPDLSQGGLLTLAPTFNGAGTRDHQMFFNNGGIYHRWGDANAGAWGGAWQKLLTSGDISGTPNRLAKFTATSALGDSRLFDDGTRVGINNFAPVYDLDVTGNTRVSGDTYVTGNLGAGTTTPAFRLDVQGESNFSQRMKIGAGNFASGYLLSVGGGIMAEEVRVQIQPWPDYVFEQDYPLMPLVEVEKYVQQNKHLPGIATAKEVQETGLDLGQSQKAQMEKIEELFLHMISLEKRVNELEKQNSALQSENSALKATNAKH